MLTIAEESTAWAGVSRPTYLGGLGFSLKWNMGWMNDTLRYMRHEPIHRQYHHDELTFSLIYAFTENFCLPLSHDEVVHGKGSLLDQMPGDLWQKFANLRLLYGYMWTHPGKKLLFMGGEIRPVERVELQRRSLQWDLLQWESHQGVQKLDGRPQRPLPPRAGAASGRLRLARASSGSTATTTTTASWRTSAGRRTRTTLSSSCCNFTPVPRHNYRIGVPEGGWYQEIFNSDSTYYGGSNVGNYPGVMAEAERKPRPAVLDRAHPAAAGGGGAEAQTLIGLGNFPQSHSAVVP